MPIKGYLSIRRAAGRRRHIRRGGRNPHPEQRRRAPLHRAARHRAAPRGTARRRAARRACAVRARGAARVPAAKGTERKGAERRTGAGGTAVGESAACPADCPRVTACGALAAARPPAQAGAARIPAFMAAAPRHPCEDGRFGSGHDRRCRRVRSAAAAPTAAPGRGALPFFWVCPAAGPAAVSRGRAVRGRPRRLRAARDAAGRPGGVFI